MVEQFGLAIIFLFLKFSISSGFTSGTISGISSSYLKYDVLSITIEPFSAAVGANFFDTSEPAENREISALEKSKSLICLTKTMYYG